MTTNMPAIENVEPSISILKNAVKIQSEKKKETRSINIHRKEDILKEPPLTISDIQTLIEDTYCDPMASSSQHNIMDINVNQQNTVYQPLPFNAPYNIQVIELIVS